MIKEICILGMLVLLVGCSTNGIEKEPNNDLKFGTINSGGITYLLKFTGDNILTINCSAVLSKLDTKESLIESKEIIKAGELCRDISRNPLSEEIETEETNNTFYFSKDDSNISRLGFINPDNLGISSLRFSKPDNSLPYIQIVQDCDYLLNLTWSNLNSSLKLVGRRNKTIMIDMRKECELLKRGIKDR